MAEFLTCGLTVRRLPYQLISATVGVRSGPQGSLMPQLSPPPADQLNPCPWISHASLQEVPRPSGPLPVLSHVPRDAYRSLRHSPRVCPHSRVSDMKKGCMFIPVLGCRLDIEFPSAVPRGHLGESQDRRVPGRAEQRALHLAWFLGGACKHAGDDSDPLSGWAT